MAMTLALTYLIENAVRHVRNTSPNAATLSSTAMNCSARFGVISTRM